MFGNVCLVFGQFLENLRKSSENRGKSSVQKIECSTQYLDIKLKFVSTRGPVISSISSLKNRNRERDGV